MHERYLEAETAKQQVVKAQKVQLVPRVLHHITSAEANLKHADTHLILKLLDLILAAKTNPPCRLPVGVAAGYSLPL